LPRFRDQNEAIGVIGGISQEIVFMHRACTLYAERKMSGILFFIEVGITSLEINVSNVNSKVILVFEF